MPTPRAGYRLANGEKVPSVTTIIGRFKDSGGLMKWAYRSGREHELLVHQGKPAPTHLYDTVEQAALAGTIAHDLIESFILDKGAEAERFAATKAKYTEGTDNEVKLRAWNAYQQFRKWLANTNIRVTHTEMGLVSEQNQFGGTLDAIGLDADGNVALLDWKSSNKIYGDMLVQLAGYSILLEERSLEIAIPPPTGYHILRVAKESADFAHHYYGELEREKKAFLLMRELYDHVYAIDRRA